MPLPTAQPFITLLGTLKVSREGPSGQQLEAETSFQRLIMSRL